MVSTYSKISLVKNNANISILMKKLLTLVFSFVLLSSSSVFANYSFPQEINCEIVNFEGNIEYDYLVSVISKKWKHMA